MSNIDNAVWSLGWLGKLDWPEFLEQHDTDPYILWALATKFRYFGRHGKFPGVLNLIAELHDPLPDLKDDDKGEGGRSRSWLLFQQLLVEDHKDGFLLQGYVPEGYLKPYPNKTALQPLRTKFITLRLDIVAAEGTPTAEVIADRLMRLIKRSPIKRIQLGHPRGNQTSQKGPGKHELDESIGGAPPPSVLLGAVEDTCPFYHHALRVDPAQPGSKISVLWDQTTIAGSISPEAPKAFPYGQQWRYSELLNFETVCAGDEELLVEEWEQLGAPKERFASMRGRSSHGAAVLGLLAGREATASLPINGVLPGEGDDSRSSQGVVQDKALDAPLAVVQLPREQTQVSSGRWLAPNVLDALRYLILWGWSFRGNPGDKYPSPMVINISYGSQTGPHDGTGILEMAMKEMCDHYGSDLALVLAAGNSHGTQRDVEDDWKCPPGGVHAHATLHSGEKIQFSVRVPPDKQNDTAVEIWFGRRLKEEQVTVRGWKPGEWVVSPEKPALSIKMPETKWLKDLDGEVIGGLIGLNKVPQAADKSMALFMLAPTQMATRHPEASAGVWTIEVELTEGGDLDVDLWVERDDTVVGATRGQQARLLPIGSGGSHMTDENTFSHIVTNTSTFAVTALSHEGKPSNYSSEGTDHRKADLSAVVDPLRTAHGMRVMGNRTGVVVRANGTSMAAPQAARWIANQLANDADLSKIRTEIDKYATPRVGKVIP